MLTVIWLLMVLPLATARITRLFVDDKIMTPVLDWVEAKFGQTSMINYGVNCRWCQSVWWSTLLTIPTGILTEIPPWTIPLLILAVAQIAPMIMAFSDWLEKVGGN